MSHAADSIIRADLLTTLGIFGKLAFPEIDVMQLIERDQMKESLFYQQLVAEGRIEGQRADVLQALELRFGAKAPVEFRDLVQNTTDSEQLSELHRLAIQSKRLTEFRRAVSHVSAGR